MSCSVTVAGHPSNLHQNSGQSWLEVRLLVPLLAFSLHPNKELCFKCYIVRIQIVYVHVDSLGKNATVTGLTASGTEKFWVSLACLLVQPPSTGLVLCTLLLYHLQFMIGITSYSSEPEPLE